MKKFDIGLFALNFVAYAGIQSLAAVFICALLYALNESDTAYVVSVGGVSFAILCLTVYKALKDTKRGERHGQ